jgi:hypothetical protein
MRQALAEVKPWELRSRLRSRVLAFPRLCSCIDRLRHPLRRPGLLQSRRMLAECLRSGRSAYLQKAALTREHTVVDSHWALRRVLLLVQARLSTRTAARAGPARGEPAIAAGP